MEEKIKAVLSEISVMLQTHGGDAELVEIAGKTVKLRLQGACRGCPHAAATIKQYIEAQLQELVDPEIVVERVADEA
ncbi:MAG: NifU family protein [Kiritimatiellae bacterium]|nr:NifU family protein [Kiritimatiellia bacterium]MBQ9345619.1 NifU family protein [Kiritimatiellia bacterium]